MSMSRKQYRDIADVIRMQVVGDHPLLQDQMLTYHDVTAGPSGDDVSSTIYNIASDLASVFEIDNPRFDRKRFMEACHIDEEDIRNGFRRPLAPHGTGPNVGLFEGDQ